MTTNYDVLIIGAGPSGLAAAYALQQQGITRIAIIEREKHLGGVPRHCQHPTFGMLVFKRPMKGQNFAQKIVARCKNITFLTSTTVVALLPEGVVQISSAKGIETLQARYVVIATGVRETPRHPRLVSGLRPQGIMTTGALQQHIYLNHRQPCQNPVIIGSELVAFSALWTLRSAGIKAAAIIEANERITAYRPCALFAKAMTTPIHTSCHLISIGGLERVEHVVVENAEGIRRQIACDAVIFTGQFVGESTLVRPSHLLHNAQNGLPIVDQQGRCSDPTYYAAGNLLHPADMGDQCYQEGFRLGQHIAKQLFQPLSNAPLRIGIKAAAPIRVISPSCIDLAHPETCIDLNLRVSQAIKGVVTLKAGSQILYQSEHRCLPERRILLKNISIANIPANTGEITLDIQ